MVERAGNVFTTPVPLLWLGPSLPLWLLLLLLLLLIALMAVVRQTLRRNREY